MHLKLFLSASLIFIIFNSFSQISYQEMEVPRHRFKSEDDAFEIVNVTREKITVLRYPKTLKLVDPYALRLVNYTTEGFSYINHTDFHLKDVGTKINGIFPTDSSVIIFFSHRSIEADEPYQEIRYMEWDFDGKYITQPQIYYRYHPDRLRVRSENIKIIFTPDKNKNDKWDQFSFTAETPESFNVFERNQPTLNIRKSNDSMDKNEIISHLPGIEKTIKFITRTKVTRKLYAFELAVFDRTTKKQKFIPLKLPDYTYTGFHFLPESHPDSTQVLIFACDKANNPVFLIYNNTEPKHQLIEFRPDQSIVNAAFRHNKLAFHRIKLVSGIINSRNQLVFVAESRNGFYPGLKTEIWDTRFKPSQMINTKVSNPYISSPVYGSPYGPVSGGSSSVPYVAGPTFLFTIDLGKNLLIFSKMIRGELAIANRWEVVHCNVTQTDDATEFIYLLPASAKPDKKEGYSKSGKIYLKNLTINTDGKEQLKSALVRGIEGGRNGLTFYRLSSIRKFRNRIFLIGEENGMNLAEIVFLIDC